VLGEDDCVWRTQDEVQGRERVYDGVGDGGGGGEGKVRTASGAGDVGVVGRVGGGGAAWAVGGGWWPGESRHRVSVGPVHQKECLFYGPGSGLMPTNIHKLSYIN